MRHLKECQRMTKLKVVLWTKVGIAICGNEAIQE
jgi:hypothetical protein